MKKNCPGIQEKKPLDSSGNPLYPSFPTDGHAAVKALLTVNDVAARLSLSAQVVRRWVRQGKLPALKMGHHELRFEREKIERWLRNQNL